MSFFEKLKSSRTWQVLIVAKLAVLGLVWALLDSGFKIGDRPVEAEPAADSAKVSGDAGASKDVAKDSKDGAAKDKPAAATGGKAESGSEQSKEGTSKTRKSFLANLLELPELNPAEAQKDELGKYMQIAERKKAQVEERLEMLKKREDQLKGLETSIDDKLKRLDEERRYFAQTIQQEKDLKGERLDKLVAMYAKMEPKKAAPVMEKLDKDLVVALFKVMPQKQITAILEAMSPDKATSISEYYGRVRSTREYDILKEMNQSLRKEFDDCKGMPKVAE